MERLSVVRSTAQRLTVTPVEDLPRIAGFLASSLTSCAPLDLEGDLLKGLNFSGPLHKLKTRLSSLLQDRTVSARLSAAVIIKAYVETIRPIEPGQWEAWARILIGCISKPDALEVKRIYIATVTRLLLLCSSEQTLQREVVSPLLPTFINNVLASVKPTKGRQENEEVAVPSQLLVTALKAFNDLISEYSTTVRPFATRIRQICLGVLGAGTTPSTLSDAATTLLCSLHLCAPKASATSDWDQGISNIIVAAHETIDILFRGVVEDWSSSSATLAQRSSRQDFSKPVQLAQVDAVGLGAWEGVHSGTLRVSMLLRWLGIMLQTRSQTCDVPFGAILDLLARVSGIPVPTPTIHVKTSAEVRKEEREELWSNLPFLHTELLRLVRALLSAYRQVMTSMAATLETQVLDIYEAEAWDLGVRQQAYRTMTCLLEVAGSSSSQLHIPGISTMAKDCCRDLLSVSGGRHHQPASTLGSKTGKNGTESVFSILQKADGISSKSRHVSHQTAAHEFMLALYEHLPAGALPHAVRTELDRTAILTNNREALLAATMNPPKIQKGRGGQPSLLPFLLRCDTTLESGVQALLRPRIPALTADLTEKPSSEAEALEDEADIEAVRPVQVSGQRSDDDEDASMVHDLIANKPSHQLHRNEELADEAAIEIAPVKRPFASTQNVVERVDGFGSAAKKLRSDTDHTAHGASRKEATSTQEVSSEATMLRQVPDTAPSQSYAAGEAVVISAPQSATAAISRPNLDDSDDDSDIPEIDPHLATDDEEDE